MKNFNKTPKIGEGIYLIPDIAEILGLPYHKVNNWANEFWSTHTFGEKGNKAINFLTLIEFYTFYQLRDKGISAQKIKKAHELISKEQNTEYPFARPIETDGKDIWYNYLENIIRADGRKQIDLKKILDPFLHKIDFGGNKIAERYFPLDRKHKIVIDPKHQFGQPTIVNTNIKASTIYSYYKGGETKQNIKYIYNLTSKQINDAILYYKNRQAA